MLSLVIGGAASGKSAYAEALVCAYGKKLIYLATMEPTDEECYARIARHKAQRAGRGFTTLERYRDLAGLELPKGSNVLLDCLGNLVANELYSNTSLQAAPHAHKVIDAVVAGVRHLAAQSANVVVVSNEVCLAGTHYAGDTLPYLQALGRINCALAEEADYVCELVAGLANKLKGEPPCTC